MVEENASTRTRHLREIEHGLADEPGLWGQQLAQFKAAGFTAEEILTVLPEVRVESVLTAHPTEAKRAAVLEQHRAIFLLLTSLEDERLTPSRREAIRDEIKIVLERLWRSGEILLEKPEVAFERRGVIFYMREVFPLRPRTTRRAPSSRVEEHRLRSRAAGKSSRLAASAFRKLGRRRQGRASFRYRKGYRGNSSGDAPERDDRHSSPS